MGWDQFRSIWTHTWHVFQGRKERCYWCKIEMTDDVDDKCKVLTKQNEVKRTKLKDKPNPIKKRKTTRPKGKGA